MDLNTAKVLAVRQCAVRGLPYQTAPLFASPVVPASDLNTAEVDE